MSTFTRGRRGASGRQIEDQRFEKYKFNVYHKESSYFTLLF